MRKESSYLVLIFIILLTFATCFNWGKITKAGGPEPPPDNGDEPFQDPIPPPPLPPNQDNNGNGEGGGGGGGMEEDKRENSSSATRPPLIIFINTGEYSWNTEPIEKDHGSSDIMAVTLFNGVGQSQSVYIATEAGMQASEFEHSLVESGEIDPSTASEFNPFGGSDVTYFVSISSHVSLDPSDPETSVGIVTVGVYDINGKTVYETKIIGDIGSGKFIATLQEQAAHQVNNFLQTLVP